MSPDLEDSIAGIESVQATVTFPSIRISLAGMSDSFRIASIESGRKGASFEARIDPGPHYDRLLQALLEDEEHDAEIAGRTFISKIFKLELGSAYLCLTR